MLKWAKTRVSRPMTRAHRRLQASSVESTTSRQFVRPISPELSRSRSPHLPEESVRKIRDIARCMICMRVRPNFLSCTLGHSFCSMCVSNIRDGKCPECRWGGIPKIPNRKLNDVASLFLAECPLKCGDWMEPYETDTHVLHDCDNREIRCAFSTKCPQLVLKDFTDHVINNHNGKLVTVPHNGLSKITYRVYKDADFETINMLRPKIFKWDDKTFLQAAHFYKGHLHFNLAYIGPRTNANNWSTSTSLNDNKIPSRCFKRQTMTVDDFITKIQNGTDVSRDSIDVASLVECSEECATNENAFKFTVAIHISRR